jgi:hypothetical protein
VDIETRVCTAVGDEFYARMNSGDTGLAPAQWLRALVEETGARLQAAIASGADDWRPLVAFLRGLAGIAPEHAASPDFPTSSSPGDRRCLPRRGGEVARELWPFVRRRPRSGRGG